MSASEERQELVKQLRFLANRTAHSDLAVLMQQAAVAIEDLDKLVNRLTDLLESTQERERDGLSHLRERIEKLEAEPKW